MGLFLITFYYLYIYGLHLMEGWKEDNGIKALVFNVENTNVTLIFLQE
jgi:hypothetical protein